MVISQPRRSQGTERWGCSPPPPPPPIFAKADLLPIDNDNEKKKEPKNINQIKFLENYW